MFWFVCDAAEAALAEAAAPEALADAAEPDASVDAADAEVDSAEADVLDVDDVVDADDVVVVAVPLALAEPDVAGPAHCVRANAMPAIAKRITTTIIAMTPPLRFGGSLKPRGVFDCAE